MRRCDGCLPFCIIKNETSRHEEKRAVSSFAVEKNDLFRYNRTDIGNVSWDIANGEGIKIDGQ